MVNLSEDIQCAGFDTRPPMLDRTDFASWQQRIRLYCQGTEGAQQLGPKRARVYSDLSPEDKDRYNVDIRATNILLQGLPKDIYTLINHYTKAKDIWDNVKMLLECSELTKEDRESQLYDDFEHFRQNKGETIHDYYVWFAKLTNDMRNIKMTMFIMQLNSKFVNNMLPEWGRFVTAVKLNRGATGYGGAQNRVGNANPELIILQRQDVADTSSREWGGIRGRAVAIYYRWTRHCLICTDIANITRKQPKPGKDEHKTKSPQEPKFY
ncbi:hypothetical protein Tco_0399907 [Tanacetum coccineum]